MKARPTLDTAVLFLGIILSVGAFVRLSSLDIGWFLQDQVRDAVTAQGILSGRDFPLVGPHAALSTVQLVGPLYYYLVAIPYGLSPNPVGGVAFVNLLGIGSIYLAYRLGREMFGPLEGLIAAGLYAVFPMAVISGKALWNPGLVPFFSTLFLLTFWRFLVGDRAWTFTLALFLLGVLLQIHMSGAIFVLLIPIALMLYRPPIRPWPLATGLLSVALVFVPYVVFQVRHGFPDADKIFAWAGTNPTSSFWLIVGRGFWTPFALPEQLVMALGQEVTPALFPNLQRLELGLLVLGIVGLIWLIVRANDRRPYIFLGLWFALPFVIVPHNRIGVMWYYFDILYPAQFLIIGVLLRRVLRAFPHTPLRAWAQPASHIILALFLSLLIAVQAWFTLSLAEVVRHAGLLRIPPSIKLTSADKEAAAIATMPLRAKQALAKSFLGDFGVDHAGVERRAHGALYQLFREDKGLLTGILSRDTPVEPSDATLHYLILRDDAQITLDQGREAKIGAYTIVAYQPMLHYQSWQWSIGPKPEWWGRIPDDSTWAPLTLPARQLPDPAVYASIPYARWPDKTVAFRGKMVVSSVDQPVWIVLNIRDAYASGHEVRALYLNGQLLKTTRTIAYDSINSHNVEWLVDLTSALHVGSNLLAFEVTGTDGEFDLDLYELRWAVGTARK